MSFEYKKRERGKFHIDPFFDLLGGETRPSPLTLIRPPATFSLWEKESNGTRLAKRKTYSDPLTFALDLKSGRIHFRVRAKSSSQYPMGRP